MRIFGVFIFFGSLIAAAYFGAIAAPTYVGARILLSATVGLLLMGKDKDESWFRFLFWTAIGAMLAVGIVSTVSMWIGIYFDWNNAG